VLLIVSDALERGLQEGREEATKEILKGEKAKKRDNQSVMKGKGKETR
jgi:hypothetical protein